MAFLSQPSAAPSNDFQGDRTKTRIDQDLPQVGPRESLAKIDTSMRLRDIDVGGYEQPSSHDWLSGVKNHEPTGKLQVYDQSTWNWPPTGGVEQTQTTQSVFVKSPRLYDPTASRNMDIHRNVETTNESSLAKIDDVAKQVESGVLSRLDQIADYELGSVEMSAKHYNSKLEDLAVLRRTFAGTIQGQVARKEHQWAVKKKFYEADLESKQIFEEVQTRIKRETQKRMDEAKKEVAQHIQKSAQDAMDKTKAEIKQRVDEQYDAARERTQKESAQLWAEQLKQKKTERSEFVTRLKEHQKGLIRMEQAEAQKEADEINKQGRLAEEFRVFCLRNSSVYEQTQ